MELSPLAEDLTKNKYDYREQWVRFVNNLSSIDDEPGDQLADRIITAVGAVVETSWGALWLHESGTSFRLVARHGYSRSECGSGDAPVLAVWLVTHDDILDLVAGDHEKGMVSLPDWLPEPPKSWVLLPLQHRGWLIGFMILQRTEPSVLDREDRDLLRLVARNAASYLAEAETSRKLREAQAFDLFHRRFAYVMHDLKNMSGQLALTLSNAERHKTNPEFIADMLDTVQASVKRMNGLISRLRGDDVGARSPVAVDEVIRAVLRERGNGSFRLGRPLRQLSIMGDAARLQTAIGHLVDNALQSTRHDPEVELTLRSVGNSVRIEISDKGVGMDDDFVREQLFAPFSSTKATGFGLGMNETRSIIEAMDGQIDVESEIGAGTTVRIQLPRLFEEQP